MTIETEVSAILETLPDHTQLPSQESSITEEDVRRTLDEIGFVPDHTQLPYEDGTFVKNFLEHPQSILLTDALTPILQAIHSDRYYCIGQDCGIYWSFRRARSQTPLRGAVAPDWFYVPNAEPLPPGQYRRSYVMWQEDMLPPLVALEFASEDGSEERDRTPNTGKFWVYENAVRPGFYGIYEIRTGLLEMYHLVENHLEIMQPNERGHYFIPQLGAALGLWYGSYQNNEATWVRWWSADGELLPIGDERAQREAERAQREAERAQREAERAEQAEGRAAKLAEMLRAMGINPDE